MYPYYLALLRPPNCCSYLNRCYYHISISTDQSNEVDRIIRNVLRQSRTGNALLELSPRQLKSYVRDLVYLDYDVNSEEHEVYYLFV